MRIRFRWSRRTNPKGAIEVYGGISYRTNIFLMFAIHTEELDEELFWDVPGTEKCLGNKARTIHQELMNEGIQAEIWLDDHIFLQ